MKLTRIRFLGRFINPATGAPVNVRKGKRVSGIGDVRFYLYRQKRVLIPENEFFSKWKLTHPTAPAPRADI